MSDPLLPPERFHELHVSLDNLKRTSEDCRRALQDLADGRVTREQFSERLERYRLAHRAWVDKNLKYLSDA